MKAAGGRYVCSLVLTLHLMLQVRWAVLNDAALLRAHKGLHERLATLMSNGASVGTCVALIEQEIGGGQSSGGSTDAVLALTQQQGTQ